ncbi:hypothetical protein [Actinoplanes sp. GCM10030250]|uniref:hypothetical protein n=1 Tax=Actinoplanes sp. GCM10030250 TaxID=3273376 RepID=UPI00361DF74A
MGDQPTSDSERAPEEATAKAAGPRPDEAVVLTQDNPDNKDDSDPAGDKPAEPEPNPSPEPEEAKARPVGEDTVVIRLPAETAKKAETAETAGKDDTVVMRKIPGEETVVLRPEVKKPVGDETVVIRLPATKPAKKKPATDDTVIIRLPQAPKTKAAGRARVASRLAGEETVVIRVPTAPEPAPKPGGSFDLGYAPWVLALSSLGVVLVALAYGGGRHESSWAMTAYWTGQVIVFSPVVFRLLSRLAGVAESFLLVIGLAANQYMLKWMYSPDQFRFPDELQHWLATTLITESGELFRPNQALPPAVHFPGLAEMGAAVSQLTGLSVTAAGTLVAGVAHLIFVGMLFAAVLRSSNSPAMAGVACVTYATAMHYLFFNSMFLYQTAALPYFMLTVWAYRRWRTAGDPVFAVLAVAGIAMTTVSHHVTAFALVATLVLLAVTELVLEKPRPWITLSIPLAALAVVAAWIGFVAQDVIAYLEAPVEGLAASLNQLFGGAAEDATATKPVPLTQLAVQGLGLLGLFVLFVAVGRDMLLRRDRDTWRWAALIGGGVFFAGNGARFLGANGPEIAGRLSTFTYIPMSIVAAIAIVYAVQIIPPKDERGRRWRSSLPPGLAVTTGRRLAGQVYLGTALITVLMIGARTGGWPPVSALLPGPYLPAAYERSVDEFGVDAARWQEATLPPGTRVGGDITTVALSSTYGRMDPVREVGELFHAEQWTGTEEAIARSRGVSYLVVDERLSEALPPDAYFQGDPMAGRLTEPIPVAGLRKFDTIPAASRLYDNGHVRIYQMGLS